MLVLVPTRSRPENALRLQQAFYATRGADTKILFCVDDDDPRGVEYAVLGSEDYVVGPRLRLGGTLNHYADMYAGDHGVVGFVGDDVIPRTVGWDAEVLNHMQPNGIVYTNDGHQGPNLPTAVFMDSAIIQKLGYMVLPGMTHLFIDNYWKELGTRLGTLKYLDHVHLEHMHPSAGKGLNDDVYFEANAHHVWDADERILTAHINSGELDRMVAEVLR